MRLAACVPGVTRQHRFTHRHERGSSLPSQRPNSGQKKSKIAINTFTRSPPRGTSEPQTARPVKNRLAAAQEPSRGGPHPSGPTLRGPTLRGPIFSGFGPHPSVLTFWGTPVRGLTFGPHLLTPPSHTHTPIHGLAKIGLAQIGLAHIGFSQNWPGKNQDGPKMDWAKLDCWQFPGLPLNI